MRIALLTLEALANQRAVRRFLAARGHEIVLVGLSDPYRPEAGGMVGQTWRHIRRSGLGFLPYLALNFGLPGLLSALFRASAEIDRRPLARACADRGIRTLPVRDVNGDEFREALAASGAELIVTFHFDQILSAETIAIPSRGGINVHPSLLPLHRGPVPTLHALIDDPVRLGISIHRLVPKIDAGGLLAQAEIADRPGLTALGAARLLHDAALPLLDRTLAALESGTAHEEPLPVLPYRGFPTPAELIALRRRGRWAAGFADLRGAFRG